MVANCSGPVISEGVVLGRALDLLVDRRQEWNLGVLSLASIDGFGLEAELKAEGSTAASLRPMAPIDFVPWRLMKCGKSWCHGS